MEKVDLVYYFITSIGYAIFWALLFATIAKSNKKILTLVLTLIGFAIGVCFGIVLLSAPPIGASISKVKQLIVMSSMIAGISGILIHKGLAHL